MADHIGGTATEPGGVGVVHDLASRDMTICGKSAVGWSREVTRLQELGLVPFCTECKEAGNG